MTTINAKKKELVALVNGIYSVQTLEGKAFALKASKNLNILQDSLKDLEVAGKPSKEFMELANQVNVIAKEDTEDSKERIEVLETENEHLVTERQEQVEALEVMMEQNLSVDLHLVTESELPDNITTQQLSGITKIIK